MSKHPSGAEGGNSSRAFRISLGAGHAVCDGHPQPLRLSIEEHPRRERRGSASSLRGSVCVPQGVWVLQHKFSAVMDRLQQFHEEERQRKDPFRRQQFGKREQRAGESSYWICCKCKTAQFKGFEAVAFYYRPVCLLRPCGRIKFTGI